MIHDMNPCVQNIVLGMIAGAFKDMIIASPGGSEALANEAKAYQKMML
jgi:hypothetical protein